MITATATATATTTLTSYIIRENKYIQESAGMVILPVARNDGKKGKSGKGIQLPAISDSVWAVFSNDAAGKQYLVGCLDGLRARLASKIYKENNRLALNASEIGITAMLALARADNATCQLTKESIAAWFLADLAPLLEAAIEEKYPTMGAAGVNKILGNYLTGYQIAAARPDNRIWEHANKVQLLAQFDKLGEDYDHPIANKILAAMAAPEPVAVSELLEAL